MDEKKNFLKWYFYIITFILFILVVSQDSFLALDLFHYDKIQWSVLFFGMFILSFGIVYTVFWLFIRFPNKLKSIKYKEIISSS